MIALNGESYRLMLFFLPSGHVPKISGIQAGAPLLSLLLLFWNLDQSSYFTIFFVDMFFQIFMFRTGRAELKGIRKSFEIQQRYDLSVRVFDKIFVMRDAVLQVLHS
jgi:hypothetical protein